MLMSWLNSLFWITLILVILYEIAPFILFPIFAVWDISCAIIKAVIKHAPAFYRRLRGLPDPAIIAAEEAAQRKAEKELLRQEEMQRKAKWHSDHQEYQKQLAARRQEILKSKK